MIEFTVELIGVGFLIVLFLMFAVILFQMIDIILGGVMAHRIKKRFGGE